MNETTGQLRNRCYYAGFKDGETTEKTADNSFTGGVKSPNVAQNPFLKFQNAKCSVQVENSLNGKMMDLKTDTTVPSTLGAFTKASDDNRKVKIICSLENQRLSEP